MIIKGMPIVLNGVEQEICQMIGKERLRFDNWLGLDPKLYSGKDPLKTNIVSFGAELAFCKEANAYPDLNCEEIKPYDVKLHGKTIDIKYQEDRNGDLRCKGKERGVWPDWYVLMTGTFPVYFYVGIMMKENLIVPERLKVIKQGCPPMYVAKQDELD